MEKKLLINDKHNVTVYYFDQDNSVASNVLVVNFRRTFNDSTSISVKGSKIERWHNTVDHYMTQKECEIYADKLRNASDDELKEKDVSMKFRTNKAGYGIFDGIPIEIDILPNNVINLFHKSMIIKFPKNMEFNNKIRYVVFAFQKEKYDSLDIEYSYAI